ncbi:MvaI/BcnI restriction endonuclease family protein [Metamycoplasma hominis]|uniref:MvaI/BcnI family restriction endonuclease n=1 Tax=Metamycoplasma hominis TaxID=2098 RepID=UPI00159302B7|nr:MvaI/BcnI family restriction endonuclease [Metamycoplasma hominis]QKX37766.1 MvaI/BcnI restriction endonuclease family protein [Metamycoplasma hominis]
MTDNYEIELINFFKDIKSREWIETTRHGDQCLGNAFEDLLGVKENNKNEADFHGIELKTHRCITSSMVSLFSKSPSHPKGVNTYLRETFGVIEADSGKQILNTTVGGDKYNTHRGGHRFKVIVDRTEKKLWLSIVNNNGIVLEGKNEGKNTNWDFSVLSNALDKKLGKIAITYGDEKDENGMHFVRYTRMLIIQGLSLEKMLKAIECGDLMIDIRIGVYASGKNKGKTHDHGTAFRIKLESLLKYVDLLEID